MSGFANRSSGLHLNIYYFKMLQFLIIIYALSIKLENPDLFILQMLLFSLKNSFNIFTLSVCTLTAS